jgi:hypothetical protein
MATSTRPRTEEREGRLLGSAQPARYFESTIVSDDGSLTAHLFAIPANYLPVNREHLNAESASELLGFTMIDAARSPSTLPYAIAAVLLSASPEQAAKDFRELVELPTENAFSKLERPVAVFSQQIAFERVVPLELSPFDLQSLASLVTGGGAAGAGIAIGLAVALGHPIVLVAAPVGIVLVVAAPKWGTKVGEIGEVLLDRVIARIKK